MIVDGLALDPVRRGRWQYRDGDQKTRLAGLLHMLHDINGIERIKFVTNYPKDMDYELLTAVRDLKKVSPYLHVPLQSGSDAVLKRMKRGYTVGDYREMMARINETLGDAAAVSSDFIVGFCGETEDEFQETVKLVEECRFKNSFIFKYSERSGTRADDLYADDIPEDVKRRRNNEMLDLQNQISEEDNAEFIGRTVEILVEGPSKSAVKAERRDNADHLKTQLVGRTDCDRIVVFDGNPRLAGSLANISVTDCTGTTLIGSIVTQQIQHGSSPLLPILT